MMIIRVLIARVMVTRPLVLIFDGTLYNKELSLSGASWTAVFVTNDPAIETFVDRRVFIGTGTDEPSTVYSVPPPW